MHCLISNVIFTQKPVAGNCMKIVSEAHLDFLTHALGFKVSNRERDVIFSM